MLLINGEYANEFISHARNAKNSVMGFVFHDSLHSSSVGSMVDRYFLELRDAKKRGVDVKILCNSEGQVEKIRRYNIAVKRALGFKTMHSKAFLFDNKYLFVGSHNATENAISVNLEMSAIIQDEESIQKFVKYFNILWS